MTSVHVPNTVTLAEGGDPPSSSREDTERERGVHGICSNVPSFHHTTKSRSVLPKGMIFRGNDDAEPLDKKAPQNKNPRAVANRLNSSFFWVHI